jgi:hypothetical protein
MIKTFQTGVGPDSALRASTQIKSEGERPPPTLFNMNKIEQQIRQVRALVNALTLLKKNTKAAPYLKGQHILGSLRAAERTASTHRNGHFSDDNAAYLLNQNIELLSKMFTTSNELISGEKVWVG